MSAPLWLQEEPWLGRLLGWFLDRLEQPRTQTITRRVKKSTVPELFQFSEDTRYRWQLMERLAQEYRVFSIHYDSRLSAFQERYENAQLRLNPACEALLRGWLDRPRVDPLRQTWRNALSGHEAHFQDGGAALLDAKPALAGDSPEDMVGHFIRAASLLDSGLTLRELSARCFRGNSKFLDGRQELLTRLFGERAQLIRPRPLLLTAWAPAGCGRLLIVENQDTFLRLVAQAPAGYALLYSGGFRASAQRLTSPHTRFAFLPGSDPAVFRQRWLDHTLAAFFWGDLDFAGLGILATLRQSLPDLVAWQPGYQPMLLALTRGEGHSAEQAGKDRQNDPGHTGCPYADRQLLPALRDSKRFLDQEAFLPALPSRG
ncbi:Wadjet anti-phage system protein JetD domain-containing protein [Alcanivorax sp. 24]|uniref:Wadjet anti-phage system protein JetD domain-containing protein n=1 Tax=Alcanivorax sp. 24 TaxID=2545266 RepID=UPI00105E6461|nr:Wadjet anti-phage system protein JetD domain-containing protein [Alcanivorax sp. 24]